MPVAVVLFRRLSHFDFHLKEARQRGLAFGRGPAEGELPLEQPGSPLSREDKIAAEHVRIASADQAESELFHSRRESDQLLIVIEPASRDQPAVIHDANEDRASRFTRRLGGLAPSRSYARRDKSWGSGSEGPTAGCITDCDDILRGPCVRHDRLESGCQTPSTGQQAKSIPAKKSANSRERSAQGTVTALPPRGPIARVAMLTSLSTSSPNRPAMALELRHRGSFFWRPVRGPLQPSCRSTAATGLVA